MLTLFEKNENTILSKTSEKKSCEIEPHTFFLIVFLCYRVQPMKLRTKRQKKLLDVFTPYTCIFLLFLKFLETSLEKFEI